MSRLLLVLFGMTEVQSMRLELPPGTPRRDMRSIASANLPVHLPWLLTKPANSLPTMACLARLTSDGNGQTPAGGLARVVSL